MVTAEQVLEAKSPPQRTSAQLAELVALSLKALPLDTQGVSKSLGIEYHLHCSWRPQSSGKVEKS